MEKEVKLGIYRHFKGKLYKVIGIARNSEAPWEEFVVYQAMYNDEKFGKKAIWIRPIGMFLGKVIVDGKEIQRFEFVKK